MVLFCDSRDILWGCFRKEISGKSWQHWKKLLMFYLIACNTNLINVDWTVASELTSYISFASISYLCGLVFNFKVCLFSEARNYTINGRISKNLSNLNDLNITFMKYNWLKPISFTSIFEFEVDPYMEWLTTVFLENRLLSSDLSWDCPAEWTLIPPAVSGNSMSMPYYIE